MKPKILIRFDDIAENMNWKMFDKVEILLNEKNIKPVLGVIPNNKDPDLLKYPKKDNFWKKINDLKDNGWEIAMHDYDHLYTTETYKKDYFKHGGRSEFFGNSLPKQIEKIKSGLKIFLSKKINIRVFFAPNHTYDENTFLALKKSGIFQVIDGYGIAPFVKKEIKFIPQLFYKLYTLPIGVQSTQIHLNYWNENDFENFKIFLNKNTNNFITYDEALNEIDNTFIMKFVNKIIEILLRLKRLFNKN